MVSWGDSVKHNRNIVTPGVKHAIQTFQAWKVVETEAGSEYGYTMKMAHLAVSNNQRMKEDRVILDPEKQAEEVKRRSEEESRKNREKMEAIRKLEEQKDVIDQAIEQVEKVHQGNQTNKTNDSQKPKKADHRPKQDFLEILTREQASR